MSASADPPRLIDLEPYVDANLYCGPYPFRPLPAADPAGLSALLTQARIEAALVTPFPALFHQRPWAGLAPWLEAFHGDSRLAFWAVINPALPGWEDDLAAAAAHPAVVGIRLFPRCHGYRPFLPALASLLEKAAQLQLPVCLTARLLDDRLYPRMLRVDPPLCLEEVGALLKYYPTVPWVLNGFLMPELRTLRPALLACSEGYADVGLSKPFEPWWETVTELFPPERLLLGTGAPLYYHGSIRLTVQHSDIAPETRNLLLQVNPCRLITRRRQLLQGEIHVR